MGELACPQCGNPNLDVDEQNSVVYCKNCGFAVKVDPQTGEAVPISQGGEAKGGAAGTMGGAPAVYAERSIFGMDPLTFWLLGFVVLLALFFFQIIRDLTILFVLVLVLTGVWWMKK